MKTTKLILIFFLISRIFIAFGQNNTQKKANVKPSKEDTENWIINKFNEFKPSSSAYTYISFSGDDLICKIGTTSNLGGDSYLYCIIPIKEIESMKYSYYESAKQYSIDFRARNNQKLFVFSTSYPPKDFTGNKEQFSIFFSKLIEDDNMKNRIYQAFERLLEIHGVKLNKVKEVF